MAHSSVAQEDRQTRRRSADLRRLAAQNLLLMDRGEVPDFVQINPDVALLRCNVGERDVQAASGLGSSPDSIGTRTRSCCGSYAPDVSVLFETTSVHCLEFGITNMV